MRYHFGLGLIFLLAACANSHKNLLFDPQLTPSSPDYSKTGSWAALPNKLDSADNAPLGFKDNQQNAEADVFFLYPTSYLGKMPKNKWNASINDAKINLSTDKSSILFQSTIFNEAGRIYAPRYRQAHYQTFFIEDKKLAQKVFDVAYSDVKAAFDYYLENYNQGRPIILVGHSQGAAHMIRLLKEKFDNTSLSSRLVVAYVIGFPVPKDAFVNLKACESAEQTSCICSWRTFRMGFKPNWLNSEKPVIITNPLNWRTNGETAEGSLNKGAVLFNFYNTPKKVNSDVKIYKNILWIEKPKFKGSFLYFSPNYHKGDLNLFYTNIRENAAYRLKLFWK